MFAMANSSRITLEKLAAAASVRSFSSTRSVALASTSTCCQPRSSTSASSSSSAIEATPTSSRTLDKTHYLVTLHRSPANLPQAIARTCEALGLRHRLASSLVPINNVSAGQVLAIKELIGIRTVSLDEVASQEWAQRPGEGKQGSGLRWNGNPNGIIRIGSERARGEERGFKVLS